MLEQITEERLFCLTFFYLSAGFLLRILRQTDVFPNEKSRMFCPNWTMLPLKDALLGRRVLRTIRPLDDASLGHPILGGGAGLCRDIGRLWRVQSITYSNCPFFSLCSPNRCFGSKFRAPVAVVSFWSNSYYGRD
jgi:hypothetical protein